MENSSKKQIIFNIPIFIEGRDEPINQNYSAKQNSNVVRNASSASQSNEIPPEGQCSSNNFEARNFQNDDTSGTSESQNTTTENDQILQSSIQKIHSIQEVVIGLMEKVEKFDGQNKKEYNYLDEMLTQNLLKLDDIDVEGKENIKNARKEAIKCINSLITLLDTKKDEFIKKSPSAETNKN